MSNPTRPSFGRLGEWLKALQPGGNNGATSGDFSSAVGPSPAEIDPPLYMVARPVRPLGPETRLGEAIETLKMGPYRTLPVVANPDAGGTEFPGTGGDLLGVLSETRLVVLWLAADAAERSRLRELRVGDVMETPPALLLPHERASDAARRMDETGTDTLPLVDYQGRLSGMVSRSDLVQEFSRPFRPPVIGGMATPIGVYLAAGNVAGGVGPFALMLTGLLMSLAYIAAALVSQPVGQMARYFPLAAQPAVHSLLQSVLQMGLFLLFVRLSPMSGFHAAEHQAVHAVERGEPLLIANVRRMPRVHPRCGTNLVAGGTILWLLGGVLEPIITAFKGDPTLAYLLSGIVAFAYWRPVGSWMQQNLTTRPATDAELESGIRAAREVLARYGPTAFDPVKPHVRLWRMGFLQILAGFAVGYGLAYLATSLFPGLTGSLRIALEALM